MKLPIPSITVEGKSYGVILSKYADEVTTAVALIDASGRLVEIVSINVSLFIPSDQFVLNHDIPEDGEIVNELKRIGFIELEPIGRVNYGYVIGQPIFKITEKWRGKNIWSPTEH